MHIASPNAGEVIQGFALALKKGIVYDVSSIVSVIFLSFEVPLHMLCKAAFHFHTNARHYFRCSFYFYLLCPFLHFFCASQDLINMVGIHPTIGEEFTTMFVTKSSGASVAKTGC